MIPSNILEDFLPSDLEDWLSRNRAPGVPRDVETDRYGEWLFRMLHSWIAMDCDADGFIRLAHFMGCRNLIYANGYRLVAPEQPRSNCEDVTRAALVVMLMHIDGVGPDSDIRGLSVLDGLLRNDRWRACLETPSGAYAFVALAARVIALPDASAMAVISSEKDWLELHMETTFLAGDVLKEWLLPPSEARMLSPRMLAAALFGEAWCNIVIDGVRNLRLDRVIAETRPPFVHGLLPNQPAPDTGVALPPMEQIK